jgi:predicted Zn-dependent protease
MESLCREISNKTFQLLKKNELLSVSFSGENSNFTRINESNVRQISNVINCEIEIELIIEQKKTTHGLTLTTNNKSNLYKIEIELDKMRSYINELPNDPFIVKPKEGESSKKIINGNLLKDGDILDSTLPSLSKVDCSGIWASGTIFRGLSNSKGIFHWFETDNYSFDFSLITKDGKMVKETYAGNNWNQKEYLSFIENAILKLDSMKKNNIKLKPGKYRTYIASAGIADLVNMFSWGGISESAIRQGGSAFCKMRDEKFSLNPQFNLSEDFELGLNTHFNNYGELSPKKLNLISSGKLKNTLISTRTALEYNLNGNKAEINESLKNPIIASGTLDKKDILKEIGTGIYLSNLHYLNWSDQPNGRITGMTRYASFWVENGEIISPIEQMRFDDSFYNFFGNNLSQISKNTEVIPDVSTYHSRSLGGIKCPGMIFNNFELTL